MVDQERKRFTGGCQCGAVRYEPLAAPHHVSVCHCRMCQKASGGPIMAFARVKKEELRWSGGRRGGVPFVEPGRAAFLQRLRNALTYNFIERANISVTACSLDDPEAVRPRLQYCVDRKLSWFASIGGLPGKRTGEFITPDLAARFVSHQQPDHEA